MEEFFSPLFFSCGVEVGRAGDGSYERTMQVHILIHQENRREVWEVERKDLVM